MSMIYDSHERYKFGIGHKVFVQVKMPASKLLVHASGVVDGIAMSPHLSTVMDS